MAARQDDTTAVVESFQQRYPSLRYERRDERGGIDRDIARTVDLARGEYCWLFCADDVMKPGAIGQMLENLNSGCDVYLCGLTLCTLDMRPLGDHRVSRIKTESQFDLSRPRDRRSYFRQCTDHNRVLQLCRLADVQEVPLGCDRPRRGVRREPVGARRALLSR